MQGLLADAAAAVTAADPAAAAVFLPAAWQAVCAVGAAAELLAERAGTRETTGGASASPGSRCDAVEAMRAVAALRSAPTEVNPPGSPASRLTAPEAEEIRAAIVFPVSQRVEVLAAARLLTAAAAAAAPVRRPQQAGA